MKRVLPLILIAFLFACNNQQNADNNTETENTEAGAGAQNAEVITEIEAPDNALVIEPERMPVADTMQPGAVGENDPRDRETAFLFNQGTTAYENGDFAGGVEIFEKVVAKQPDSRQAYYNLGLGYFKIQKFAESIQAFSSAIDIAPNNAQAITYRGRVYYTIGDFPNCLKDYDKVVSLQPNDAVGYYNRGIAKGQLKDYLGAIQDFDEAIKLNPDYAEAYFNRGLANYFQGRMHEACYDWRKAHSLGHYESEKALRAYCDESE